MKKTIISFLILFLILFLLVISTSVFAENEDNDINDVDNDAGITPDRPILWGLDRAIERIQILLTFDVAHKAERRLQHASERLAEVKVMIEQKKLEAAEKAEKAHEEEIDEVEDIIQEIEYKNSTEELDKVVKLRERIRLHNETLSGVRDIVMANVKPELSPIQEERFNRIIQRFENKTLILIGKFEAKENATKGKIVAEHKGNKSEKIISDIEKKYGNEGKQTATKAQNKR